MLVLTRRLNQAIFIGDPESGLPPIEITIQGVRGEEVRVGVVAPKDLQVHRLEIYLQIQRENKSSAASGALSTVGKTLDQIRQMQRQR